MSNKITQIIDKMCSQCANHPDALAPAYPVCTQSDYSIDFCLRAKKLLQTGEPSTVALSMPATQEEGQGDTYPPFSTYLNRKHQERMTLSDVQCSIYLNVLTSLDTLPEPPVFQLPNVRG